MARRLELERAVGRQPRLDAVDRLRIAGARLADVDLCCGLDRPMQIDRARSERIGQRQQNAPDFLGFLLFERDDVVVDFDRAERLEEQAGAARRRAVHDAGNAGAVFGLHDEHVAPVALGDDLLLKILGRFLAAQIRLERAPQARLLLPQPLADQLQLGARMIDDFARRVDLVADLRDFALEGRQARAHLVEQRTL